MVGPVRTEFKIETPGPVLDQAVQWVDGGFAEPELSSRMEEVDTQGIESGRGRHLLDCLTESGDGLDGSGERNRLLDPTHRQEVEFGVVEGALAVRKLGHAPSDQDRSELATDHEPTEVELTELLTYELLDKKTGSYL